MSFFHHKTIRIYTLALLETFNDIEIQNLASDGTTVLSSIIPIKFSSREKALILDEYETKEITKGNFNTLPRMSLVFSGLSYDGTRQKNKFLKINKVINGETIQFQNNSVPYLFNYEIICKARGMTEASMIIEQISSYFNPSYTLKVKEIPIQDEFTTIQLNLEGISIEQEEYEEFSKNIVTISFPLTLKGNIYPAIKDQGVVKSILWYLNNQTDNEYQRASLIEFDGQDVTKYDFGPYMGTLAPVITDIQKITQGAKTYLKVIFEDKDNKPDEFTFVWVKKSGSANIETGKEIIEITNLIDTNNISVTIIDIHKNQVTFNKNIS